MTLLPVPSDPVALRSVYSHIPQSVVALGALDDAGTPRGLVASTFTPISLDPPLVSVAVADTSTSWPTLRTVPHLGISLLSVSQGAICRQLARRDGRRFDGVQWTADSGGAVYIERAAAHLDCGLHEELTAGDHTIVLLRINSYRADDHTDPLVFHSSGFRPLAGG